MTPDEYTAKQAAISAAISAYVLQVARFFTRPALTIESWAGLLELLFPRITAQREASAALAREFYDSERRKHVPELPRNDRLLEGTDFGRFVANMEPTRKKMSLEDSPRDALTMLTLRAVREVENAGRQQIIHAVQDDEDLDDLREAKSTLVRGWARVATGRETCAWCLMLVSRGPVYLGAHTAGLDLDDESAIEAFNEAGGDLQKFYDYLDENNYMEEWHTGCDCKVVPVFKISEWPGRDAWKRAEGAWIDASKEARKLIDTGEARTENLNKETLNALRRRLYRGELEMSEFTALAA